MKATAVIFLSLLMMTLAATATEEKASAPTKPSTAPAQVPASEANAAKAVPAKPAPAKPVQAAKIDAAPKASLPKDIKKLIVEDTIVGNGKSAEKGKSIKVHYTGWLYDPSKPMGRGKQFDTSAGKEPFAFNLGGGQVIKGWDEGFSNMKVGGKRKLIIPSEMGYGERGAGTEIPPGAALMFEVELLDVM